METTILKLSELYRKEGLKEYNEYIDFLNKKFNSYSLDELTQMMKNYLSFIVIHSVNFDNRKQNKYCRFW